MILASGVSLPTAAIIAAIAGLVGLWVGGLRSERSRRREFYAKALEATLAYGEFPFVIRRRDDADPPGERVRISEARRSIQRDLATFESLMRIERAGDVAANYRAPVAKTRETAGGYMAQEWRRPPIPTTNR
jgi:hypothetical protein